MKKGKGHSSRAALRAPFHIETYLHRVLSDLRVPLGEYHSALLAALLDGPDAFRRACDCALDHDAVAYVSIRRTAALRQVQACVSKLESFGATSAEDRKQRALQSFMDAEAKCKRTNKRLAFYQKFPRRYPALVGQVIRMAQDEISRVLGGPPSFEMFEAAAFGPGLTFGLPPEDRDLYYKISGDQDVTPACKGLALEVITKLHPRWGGHLARHGYNLTCVPGNRIAFVPKSFKTLRTIGIEPSLNVWLQKGVDEWLKARLRLMNLFLRSQEYSSDLIRKESRDVLGVATLDLKAASDTIARELVRLLLPPEWYELLDVLRSPCYTLDKGKTWHQYHKFSSMGNATTFPVESMIFGSLARACARICGEQVSRVRTYGDDVIVPPSCAALVIEVFRFCGFSINTEKSFVHGPFKETCGVDLLNGVDIRPVYLRKVPRTPDTVANLFNRLLVHAFGFTFPATLEYLHSLVSRPLYGPAYFGWTSTDRLEDAPWQEWYEGRNTLCDAYFFAPGYTLPSAWSKRYQTYRSRVKRWHRPRRPRKGTFDENCRYAAFLYGLEDGMPRELHGRLTTQDTDFYGPWPDVGWWPSCYPSAVPLNPLVCATAH